MRFMSWVTIIWSMGASACLTLAGVYFLVWLRNRSTQAHLLFAVAATSTAAFAFCELATIRAQTPQELDDAIRWGHVPLFFCLVSLTWFVRSYLDGGRRWLAWTICALRIVFVVPSLLSGGNPNFRSIPSLQHIQFLGESLTVTKGVPTPWALLGSFSVLLILIFVADAGITAWRRGDRLKALMVGGSVEFFLLTGLATSMLMTWTDFKMPQAISLYYLGLIAMMGYELSRDVLRASQLADDLRASEGRSLAILRAVPDLMFLQTEAGIYVSYHASDPRLLLAAPEQFLGRNMRDVLPPSLLRIIEPAFAQVADATQPVVVEYDLDMPHGNRWYEARLVRSYDRHILTLVRDITERKHAEDALRISGERYALATMAGSVGIWDWNLEANSIYVDPTLRSILGFEETQSTISATEWGSRVHGEDLARVTAQTQACIEGGINEYAAEHRMVHKDGTVRWFLSCGSLLRHADGRAHRMFGTKVDITERKRAEEAARENEAVLRANHQQIRDLAGRLIAAQEVERARIARDLHDDLSQQVASLSIALSAVKRRAGALPGAGDLQREVSSLQQRTVTLAENIRHVSHDLHSSVLDHSGLVAALADHCARQHGESLQVTFRVEGDFESTAMDVALCLYRVAQEALRNVVTHARARHADVHLVRIDNLLELTIADDGSGFDSVQVRKSGRGLGLVSISERVRLAGGTVSIATEWNKGTRVRVQVPSQSVTTSGVVDAAKTYTA
jgi:PAS domain S-box-containing protein